MFAINCSRTSLLTVLGVVYAIVRLSSGRQDYGFDSPCGVFSLRTAGVVQARQHFVELLSSTFTPALLHSLTSNFTT